MASLNPSATLAWLKSKSDMEAYLGRPEGKDLFGTPSFQPHKRYAYRDVEIAPRVGTRIGPEHLSGDETVSFPIPTHGDLLSKLTLRMKINIQGPMTPMEMRLAGYQVLHPLAQLMRIAQADLVIGNKTVQTLYGECSAFFEYARNGAMPEVYPDEDGNYHMFVDLPFYFCKERANAIPLYLLTQHNLELRLRLKPAFERHPYLTPEEQVDWPSPTLLEIGLVGRYVFTEQRDIPSPYQRIIEEWSVHRVPIEGPAGLRRVALPFRGPASALFFRFQDDNPKIKTIGLSFNNLPVYDPQPPEFFQDHASHTHHLNALPLGLMLNGYVVHFDENGDAATPDGHVDLSGFDRVELLLDLADEAADGAYLHVFARGWNVLTLRDGMAGKLFMR